MTCPDPIDLAEAESLAATHPLREHLRDCGRCRATLKAMKSFLDEGSATADDDVSAEDLADADARLAAFLADQLHGRKASPRTAPAPGRSSRGWYRHWMAAAAALLVAIGIWQAGPRVFAPDLPADDPLRGDMLSPPGTLTAVTLAADPTGGLLVRWEPVEGAREYQVILWDEALVEIGRLDPVTGPGAYLDRDTAASLGPVFLSVVARQAGREIARSDLVSLP